MLDLKSPLVTRSDITMQSHLLNDNHSGASRGISGA
jgi:hypothetical protein